MAGGARGRPGQRKGDFLGGKYLLEDCLGIGGMGEVYRATNVSLGRKVAIKILSREYVNIEDDVLRFLREARAAAAVRHPNVVDVLDVAREDDGTPFIVQELLDGEDLEQYLKKCGLRISAAEALEILIPVASAVAAAHARDVVHRDLKPANIFLSRDGGKITPKVLDFGACLFPTLGERSAKEIRLLIGTPHYMAPEQIVSKTEVDALSDVWALGVILYELLVGETPFEAESAKAVLELVKTKDVPPLSEKVPGVPAALAELVGECTQRDRARRPKTAMDLRDRMEFVRERLRGPGRDKLDTQPEVLAPRSVPKLSSIPPVLDPRAVASPRIPSFRLDTPVSSELTRAPFDRDELTFDELTPRKVEKITLDRIPIDKSSPDPIALDTPVPSSLPPAEPPPSRRSPPAARIVRSAPWSRAAIARFAAAVLLPGSLAFVALMLLPVLSLPLGRALRGDSTVASGVLAVVVLVIAALLGARSVGATHERATVVAAGGAVLFGMVMIVVTFSAGEAAEIGVPPAAAAIAPFVGPIAPLALAASAVLRARTTWLDPYERRSAVWFAAFAGAMVFLMLALSPMGAVRVAVP